MNKLNLDLNGLFDITIMNEALRIFDKFHFNDPPDEIQVLFNKDILETDGERIFKWVQSKPFIHWPIYNIHKEATHKIYLKFPEQTSFFDTFVSIHSKWKTEEEQPYNHFNYQVIRNDDIRGCL